MTLQQLTGGLEPAHLRFYPIYETKRMVKDEGLMDVLFARVFLGTYFVARNFHSLPLEVI